MDRRQFLQSSSALAISPALPVIAGPTMRFPAPQFVPLTKHSNYVRMMMCYVHTLTQEHNIDAEPEEIMGLALNVVDMIDERHQELLEENSDNLLLSSIESRNYILKMLEKYLDYCRSKDAKIWTGEKLCTNH